MTYDEIVALRRGLKEVDGYKTLAQVGLDGPWVTPYQKASCSPDGPVLVAYNWLDVESVDEHRDVLELHGYLPCMAFNRVLGLALEKARMRRGQIYVTQAFHLLPVRGRSTRIPPELVTLLTRLPRNPRPTNRLPATNPTATHRPQSEDQKLEAPKPENRPIFLDNHRPRPYPVESS